MKTHILKTVPPYFDLVVSGLKKFEIRKNDRDFFAGDTLVLKEYDDFRKIYTGREIECVVEYILFGGQFGIKEGYCVMSIKIIE